MGIDVPVVDGVTTVDSGIFVARLQAVASKENAIRILALKRYFINRFLEWYLRKFPYYRQSMSLYK